MQWIYWNVLKRRNGEITLVFPLRAWLLRLALGRRTFDYMVRSVQADKRTPGARLVDIVVRQDAREERIEADWVKRIARIVKRVTPKPL